MVLSNPFYKRFFIVTAIGLLIGLSATVHAEIYKQVDADGHITYSNSPSRGAQKLNLEPISTMMPSSRPKTAIATPASFPKVDSGTQRNRDDMRHKILGRELSDEEKLLVEARQEYNNGEPGRLGDERNNYQKYLDRVERLKAAVTLHEKNIEALKRELANSK